MSREKGLAWGLAAGVALATLTASVCVPAMMTIQQRVAIGGIVLGGPCSALILKMDHLHPVFLVSWCAVPLLCTYIVKPSRWTACLLAFGFAIWYLAGVLTAVLVVWGA